jgi:MFS family permease
MFLFGDADFYNGQLGLDDVEAGRYRGIQIWPFALRIIIFSLIIDKDGYKFSMIFAAAAQIIWAIMGIIGVSVAGTNPELAKPLLYWGGLILALGNGTVEAFINPVVATMYTKDKTKWLNILHAGWPGGLVIAGVITILLGSAASWELKLGIIIIPAVVYFFMLIKEEFPIQERVASGVSYRDMLKEFGGFGALIVAFLLFLQLDTEFMKVLDDGTKEHPYRMPIAALCVIMVLSFTFYTRSLGRPLMGILVLIMAPLATTEIGTDGWIEELLKGVVPENFDSGWVLVYTSVIMMGLRFLAGPIVHALKPVPLLILSSVLAIAGLWTLSTAAGLTMLFVTATLYALGKTFFWPTMLGIVSEQTPKGGALTLNAVSGIGMLAVGVLGFPYIGKLKSDVEIKEVAALAESASVEGLIEDGAISANLLEEKDMYLKTIKYNNIKSSDFDKLVEKADKDIQDKISGVRESSPQLALKNMALFPLIMLIAYIGIYFYFRSKGGYKPLELTESEGESSGG